MILIRVREVGDREMQAKIEKWYPLTVGTLAALIAFGLERRYSFQLPPAIKDVLTATTTLSSIIVAFLAAVQAILFSINQEQVVRNLKQAFVYKKLINYLMDAIHWSILLAVISSAGLILDFSVPQKWYLYAFYTWIFVLAVALLSCYRIIRLFNRILRSLG